MPADARSASDSQRPIRNMRHILADASAGTSVTAAIVSGVTLNDAAALVAVVAGLYSIFDRWDRRRRGAEPASE